MAEYRDPTNISAGATVGRTIAKAVKPKPLGMGIGTGVSRISKPRSSGSSKSRAGNRYNPSGGGGSSGGGSSSGGGGGGSPSIAAYLGGDSIYQGAVSGGKRTLADFVSELGRRRGEAGTQFNQTKASMERDRMQQLNDLREEFASRGLIQSGIYGQEQGKFQQQFTQQQTALEQQQAALLADLLSQEKNYRREQDLALQSAKQEALQRRAARYNIGA